MASCRNILEVEPSRFIDRVDVGFERGNQEKP